MSRSKKKNKNPPRASPESQPVTRSWFAVLNHPEDRGYTGTPQEICERLRDEWIEGGEHRTGAWAYCISAAGLHHVHMVLEDEKPMRFSLIKKSYAIGAHLEPTKGTKSQAEAYIAKEPPFDEKGEEVVCIVKAGEIRGNAGNRSDLRAIEALIAEGRTPEEIFAVDFSYRRYTKEVRAAFFDKRKRETPPIRDIKVHYLVGYSGTGKSYRYAELCKQFGENEIYLVSDYSTAGGFDMYEGQRILFMDEYKGQLSYDTLLSICDVYRKQLHARYANIWMLWSEVYITSVYPPESIYLMMVEEDRREIDTIGQWYRRISDITYCYYKEGEYGRFTIPMSEYLGYTPLQRRAFDLPPIPSLFETASWGDGGVGA